MKYFFIVVVGLCFIGCVDRVNNMFVETKKVTPKYTSVGSINKKAPIIKEPKPAKSVFQEQDSSQKAQKQEFDMVGYVVSYEMDRDLGLYIYTFTDALRTDRIKFFTNEKLPYKPTQLVKIYVKDNFLKNHQIYRSLNGKRSFNHYIKAAKEYIIKVK